MPMAFGFLQVHGRRFVAVALAAMNLVGCAGQPPLRTTAPTVLLPIERAGIRDARAAFAPVFERELAAAGSAGGSARWLHLPEAADVSGSRLTVTLDERFAQRRGSTVVLVVPGLFGDCVDDQSVPFGDGRVRPRDVEARAAYDEYRDLGLLDIRKVDLAGRATSERNTVRLAAVVRAQAARAGVDRIVLVGYSKGTTDAMHALAHMAREGGVPRQLVALVSVAGVVMGTPLADQFEGVYRAVSPHVSPFDCSDAEGGELASLTRRERARWLSENPLPPGIGYHSVVAWTTRDDQVATLLRPTHRWLSGQDSRNDGQMLARDAILPAGELLAEANADHWDVALPRDRHPSRWVRMIGSAQAFPREALFRALVRWAVGTSP